MKTARGECKAKSAIPGYRCAVVITLTGLLAWGSILFSDYKLYDSWWTHHFLHYPGQLWCWERICREVGRPLDYYWFLSIAWTGNLVMAAKWVGVVAWIASAVLFSRVLVNGLGFSRNDSIAIACIATSLPFFDLLGELCMFMYATAPLLFWAAWLLFLSNKWDFSFRSLVTRAATLLLFFLSFNLNSQIPYFYAVAFALFLCAWRTNQRGLLREIGVHVRRYPDFYLLPLIFWSWKSLFCPLQGIYKEWNYNAISLNPESMLPVYWSLLSTFSGELVEATSSSWRILVPVIIAVAVAIWLARNPESLKARAEKSRFPDRFYIALGFLLLFSASFPYAVTQKAFGSFGWESRNAVLLAFPVALILFCVMRQMHHALLPNRPRSLLVSVVALVTVGIISANCSTLRLQALGAKQDCIANKLKVALGGTDIRAVSLRDYYQIPGTIYFYPHVMWTYIATDMDKLPSVLVVDTRIAVPDQIKENPDGSKQPVVPMVTFDDRTYNYLIEQTTTGYALTSLPKTGETLTAVVTEGKNGSDGVAIGARYFYYRYFKPASLKQFVKDIAKVSVIDRSQQTISY